MADDSLDILVKVSSDTAGAKQAKAELEELALAAGEYAEGLKESEARARSLIEVQRELEEASRRLSGEMAGQGGLGRAALEPWITSLERLSGLYGEVAQQQEKLGRRSGNTEHDKPRAGSRNPPASAAGPARSRAGEGRGSGVEGSEAAELSELPEAKALGAKANTGQTQALKDLAELLRAHKVNNDRMVELIAKGLGDAAATARRLRDLENQAGPGGPYSP